MKLISYAKLDPRWPLNIKPPLKSNYKKRKRDITKTDEYIKFRLSVLNRDHFTCISCGKVGGYLEVHHIKKKSEFPELATEVDNGATLCINCHYTVHPDLPATRPWKTE